MPADSEMGLFQIATAIVIKSYNARSYSSARCLAAIFKKR